MRSYGQYCPLARALDLVGDRWTLLIVRELFSRESRYSDLREALPGIATNLLANRLRQLEKEGLIESYEAPSPVRASVYKLTPRGRGLRHVLRALVAWGAPLLATGQADDAFQTHWLTLALPIFFDGIEVSDLAPLTVLVLTGNEPATIEIGPEGLRMRHGKPVTEDAVEVEGTPESVIAFLTSTAGGRTPAGVSIRGPSDAVGRLHTLTARSPLASSLFAV